MSLAHHISHQISLPVFTSCFRTVQEHAAVDVHEAAWVDLRRPIYAVMFRSIGTAVNRVVTQKVDKE